MSDWRPIETAPKDGTWFLAYVPEFACMAWGPHEFCAWTTDYSGRSYWCETDTSEEIEPIHWMPLPSPPIPA